MQPGQGGNTKHVFICSLIGKKSNASIRLTQWEKTFSKDSKILKHKV